jgi:hypothetical protein
VNATFSFGYQIQPRNGQKLNACEKGFEACVRSWSAEDMSRFPQAHSGVTADCCLVVDLSDNSVWQVAVKEALAAGLHVECVEYEPGEPLWCAIV